MQCQMQHLGLRMRVPCSGGAVHPHSTDEKSSFWWGLSRLGIRLFTIFCVGLCSLSPRGEGSGGSPGSWRYQYEKDSRAIVADLPAVSAPLLPLDQLTVGHFFQPETETEEDSGEGARKDIISDFRGVLREDISRLVAVCEQFRSRGRRASGESSEPLEGVVDFFAPDVPIMKTLEYLKDLREEVDKVTREVSALSEQLAGIVGRCEDADDDARWRDVLEALVTTEQDITLMGAFLKDFFRVKVLDVSPGSASRVLGDEMDDWFEDREDGGNAGIEIDEGDDLIFHLDIGVNTCAACHSDAPHGASMTSRAVLKEVETLMNKIVRVTGIGLTSASL